MKNSINDVIDLLQRRARDYIYEDAVGYVYAVIDDPVTTYYIILDRCVSGAERVRMENRYRRILEDVSDHYKVEVLNVENHLAKTLNRFLIYSAGDGFSVPMHLRNTNRNF